MAKASNSGLQELADIDLPNVESVNVREGLLFPVAARAQRSGIQVIGYLDAGAPGAPRPMKIGSIRSR
jgi:hypothetical protein